MNNHDQKFDTEQEALDYKRDHQLHQREPEQLSTGKWALIFPIKAHLQVVLGAHGADAAPACPGTIGANVSTFWDDVLPVDSLVRPADSPAARQVIKDLLDAEQRISTLTVDALERLRDRCAELLQAEDA